MSASTLAFVIHMVSAPGSTAVEVPPPPPPPAASAKEGTSASSSDDTSAPKTAGTGERDTLASKDASRSAEGSADVSSNKAAAESTASPVAADRPTVYVHGWLGAGIVRRTVLPVASTPDGAIKTTPVGGALAFGLTLGGFPDPNRGFEAALAIDSWTSLGTRARATHPLASPRNPRARFEHARAAVLLLGWASKRSVAFGTELGYRVRPFIMESKIQIPSYLLQGPVMALVLRADMLDRRLRLQIAPDVGLDVAPANLRALGVAKIAPAVGGGLRLEARLFRKLFLFVAYRQAHSLFKVHGRTADSDYYLTAGVAVRSDWKEKVEQ
jgi:hypothetical protein